MRPVQSFSGGWRMRLALARALMAPSELLLLDEPTNHLDLDAMLWLEKWLAAYPGTVMLISHDTEFLDAVAKSILHFDHAKLVRYRGGYNDYLTQRAERLRLGNIAYERQQREAARLQGFIDRFKAKASKAKQAQSRVKALARMQVLAPLQAEAGIDIRIPSPDQVPDPLLTLEHLSAGYTDAAGNTVPILRDVTLMVRAGSRVGVLGANGAGKSTLIKTLAEELPVRPASAAPRAGWPSAISTSTSSTCWTWTARRWRTWRGWRPRRASRSCATTWAASDSPATRSTARSAPCPAAKSPAGAVAHRLAKPNLLLLDEPSNHLDVETREALAAALAEFGGSMLLVSHDRHLLRTTVDSFWIVADGAVREFDGDLEDYRDWLAARNAGERAEARENAEGADPVVDRKAQRRAEAEQRQRLAALRKPLEARLAKVETEMEKLRASCRRWMRPSPIRTCTPTNAAPNARRSWPSTANTASAWTSWKSSGWSCKARWRKSGSPKPDDKRRGDKPLLDYRPRAHLISIIIIIYTSSRIWL